MSLLPLSLFHLRAATIPILTCAVLGYLALCAALRFRGIKNLQRRMGFTDRASLKRMTNDEAQIIVRYIIEREFPMFYELALQFALFKTYGIGSISKLIMATKNLADPVHSFKRYEDTVIIFGEFSLFPPSSKRALNAIARMNYLHSPYKAAGRISNEDFLYTLAVAVLEPIRFIRLYEWRPLTDMEVCALGTFWKSIGDAMEIEYHGHLAGAGAWRDGIEFVEDIAAWAKSYETDVMKPADSNVQPSRQLLKMMIWHVPRFAKPFAEEVFYTLMGDRVRDAFLFPEPSVLASAVAYNALLLRRFTLRHLCLPRFVPKSFFSSEDPKTGRVHHYQYLVHPYYIPVTLWSRYGPTSWITRLLGGVAPGDSDGMFPEGYLPEDIGPLNKLGKGTEEMARDVANMAGRDLGGCPFSAMRK
ncbi:hypothetical protein SODALDRAFT_335389 [Sodiomyces alkalinus F11]|uniref:ER-bound oxygenase mpaB/mpaB'/Rubber oxygenase catalytic domain-containing protein n=1 Tax=Sodiomyces alkalinus (strain CBS 110278 / VKM F-3762 / F11) TaxID=1314773 RepID=A0A3N2PP44_SODAK|nr:hypothetical protein SODALDRAFT_335389 [Sodiomyces alkalinus F11]ROT36297.1 hypothetical protein SODALDRAFT_335389 [Sodiomyces alkalinus F11]